MRHRRRVAPRIGLNQQLVPGVAVGPGTRSVPKSPSQRIFMQLIGHLKKIAFPHQCRALTCQRHRRGLSTEPAVENGRGQIHDHRAR